METRWTGTLRGALLTAFTGEYNYRLLRRALPEVRYFLGAHPNTTVTPVRRSICLISPDLGRFCGWAYIYRCAGPGIIRQGRRACRTGLVASTPELSVGGPGWLRLWGVAGSPSVDTLAKVDAPSSPELTVRADGDAVDWNAPRSVTYGLHGGI